MAANQAYVRALRRGLKLAAVKADAEPMRAYMKSEMPYRGVKKKARASVSKAVILAHPLGSYADWRDTIKSLFTDAKHREERSAALDLLGHRSYRAYRDRWGSFSLFEVLIVKGAWWDLVDEIATQHVGPLLELEPERGAARLRKWMASRDMWLRRAAVIGQIKCKQHTNEALQRLIADGLVQPMT